MYPAGGGLPWYTTAMQKSMNPKVFAVCICATAALFFCVFFRASSGEQRSTELLVQYTGDTVIEKLVFRSAHEAQQNMVRLQRDPRVTRVDFNYTYRESGMLVVPNDPLFDKEKYLGQISVPGAWQLTTGSAKTVVAVLDSGVDINHPDLRANIWTNPGETPGDGLDNDNNGYVDDINGWDFINDIPDPSPKFKEPYRPAGIHHGTLVSGLIAAQGNNSLGITGVSWHTKIMPLQVLDANGEGDVLGVVKAIEYAIAKKVDVLNLSFVGEGNSSYLRDVIKKAHDAGIVIVAASGNDETQNVGVDLRKKPLYPVCYDFDDNAVIGVAALDQLDQKAGFSNYGTCIDVSAPGINFTSTQVVRYEYRGYDTYYGTGWSGTSLATALVSGSVALLKSVGASFSPREVASYLTKNCDSIDALNPDYVGLMGCGKIDVDRAVVAAVNRVGGSAQPEGGVFPRILVSFTDTKGALKAFNLQGNAAEPSTFMPFGKTSLPVMVHSTRTLGRQFYIATTGAGGEPRVRIFDAHFQMVNEFFAYDKKYRGGVSIALADTDGDGIDEIITAPQGGGGPHVKIFDQFGNLKKHFFAYQANFRDGVQVAAGDMNNDGKAEIFTAPSKNNQGDVRIFTSDGRLVTQFFAYPKQKIATSIAVGDLDGDGELEIIAAPKQGRAPVRIFSPFGKVKAQFFPFGSSYANGVSVAIGDVNGDRRDDVVIGPAGNGGAHIRIFDGSGRVLSQFFARKDRSKGLVVSTIN